MLSLTPYDAEGQEFAALGVPAVLVDAYHPALPTVQIDDVAGAGTAVRHLINLGHRRIAFVGETLDQNPLKFQPIGDRYHGYRQVCLLYTSDGAAERSSVNLGGTRITKKKKNNTRKQYRREKRTIDKK